MATVSTGMNRKLVSKTIDALTEDKEVSLFLAYSLGRVLIEDAEKRAGEVLLPSPEAMTLVVDWLAASLAARADWTGVLDRMQRPKKLMRFSSVDQIVHEAERSLVASAQADLADAVDRGLERRAARFDDGHTLVLTDLAQGGDLEHLVLRDRFGRTAATVEIDTAEQRVRQLAGVFGGRPSIAEMEMLVSYFRERGVRLSQVSAHDSEVYDAALVKHDVRALPDGVVIDGDLEVYLTSGVRFPPRMTVMGSMRVVNSMVDTAPSSLVVSGDLVVEGGVFSPGLLSHGIIAVSGNATIRDVIGLRGIASEASIGGHLDVRGTAIERLPPRIEIGTDVRLDDTSVVDLGGLRHARLLRVRGGKLRELPDRLELTKLIVEDTPLVCLPPRLTVTKDLSLRETLVTSLPEGLFVGGDLDITRSPIVELPAGLTVKGEFIAVGTDFTFIPAGFSVGGGINLNGGGIESLDGLGVVKGNLNVQNTDIETLPCGLVVEGAFLAAGSRLATVDGAVEIGRHADITGTPFADGDRSGMTAAAFVTTNMAAVKPRPASRVLQAGVPFQR
jgi:hypothetical protein